MTDLQTLWRTRSDDQVRDALVSLGDYNQEAQAVIRAEQVARGLPAPVLEPMPAGEVRDVERAHSHVVILVALQATAFLYFLVFQEWLPGALRGPLTSVTVLIVLVTLVAVPIAIRRLVRQLGLDPGPAGLLWMMPLLSVLFVLNYRSISAGWQKRRRVGTDAAGVASHGGR